MANFCALKTENTSPNLWYVGNMSATCRQHVGNMLKCRHFFMGMRVRVDIFWPQHKIFVSRIADTTNHNHNSAAPLLCHSHPPDTHPASCYEYIAAPLAEDGQAAGEQRSNGGGTATAAAAAAAASITLTLAIPLSLDVLLAVAVAVDLAIAVALLAVAVAVALVALAIAVAIALAFAIAAGLCCAAGTPSPLHPCPPLSAFASDRPHHFSPACLYPYPP
jgi:hypothetical protein